MRHREIARVQVRKLRQGRSDLVRELEVALAAVLSPSMIAACADTIAADTWVVGHGYRVADAPDKAGAAILEPGTQVPISEEPEAAGPDPRRPRLRVIFAGRTPVPPYGGFAAQIDVETPTGWRHLVSHGDWDPASWSHLPSYFADEFDSSE